MQTTYVAVLGRKALGSQIIGHISTKEICDDVRQIQIAGDYTDNGQAVNVSLHKISRSVCNLKKAMKTKPISLHAKSGTFTFLPV